MRAKLEAGVKMPLGGAAPGLTYEIVSDPRVAAEEAAEAPAREGTAGVVLGAFRDTINDFMLRHPDHPNPFIPINLTQPPRHPATPPPRHPATRPPDHPTCTSAPPKARVTRASSRSWTRSTVS